MLPPTLDKDEDETRASALLDLLAQDAPSPADQGPDPDAESARLRVVQDVREYLEPALDGHLSTLLRPRECPDEHARRIHDAAKRSAWANLLASPPKRRPGSARGQLVGWLEEEVRQLALEEVATTFFRVGLEQAPLRNWCMVVLRPDIEICTNAGLIKSGQHRGRFEPDVVEHVALMLLSMPPSRPSGTAMAALRAWVVRVARNKSIDMYRRYKREVVIDDLPIAATQTPDHEYRIDTQREAGVATKGMEEFVESTRNPKAKQRRRAVMEHLLEDPWLSDRELVQFVGLPDTPQNRNLVAQDKFRLKKAAMEAVIARRKRGKS